MVEWNSFGVMINQMAISKTLSNSMPKRMHLLEPQILNKAELNTPCKILRLVTKAI